MKKFSWTISRYLLQNILPYFIFSWLLLSVILFVQQASRYADIFFSVSIPRNLVWQLTFALVPNVIAFTAPMAILIGVIIGLTKMQGDSELTAIRAAGAGNLQISMPIVVLGLLLSSFAFFINLKGVPVAANLVRSIALQTALYKLESPIEPGVFNTEIGGYTIYVKGGDIEKGVWEKIFIYNEDQKGNQARLITSEKGRIDSTLQKTGETAELVLQNALVTTLPLKADPATKSASESIGELRLSIRTRRDDLVKKLSQTQEAPEELGLNELARLADKAEGKEKTEATILWQRRVLLSVTPLIFALLGTSLVLRFNRGGRGFGIFLALACLIAYYLLTLFGEQLARTGRIGVWVAGFLPIAVSSAAIAWFFLSHRLFRRSAFERLAGLPSFDIFPAAKRPKITRPNFILDLTTGIRDFDIVFNLAKYFILTLGFLTSIYLIFTTFEMWKFAGSAPNGLELLGKYLFYLVPLIYIQLAPSALMIATLATFVIKSRQNEIVTWTSAGQSVYRLLFPCFVFMLLIGLFNLGLQELVAPKTNQKQDTIRSQIRNKGILAKREGKYWVANGHRIYSFDSAEKETGSNRKVSNLTVYEFAPDNQKLLAVYRTPSAVWQSDKITLAEAEKTVLRDDTFESLPSAAFELVEPENPFNNLNQKPSYLNMLETKYQLDEAESDSDRRNLEIALQKKYTTPLLPFLITLFTAPFALSFNRQGKVLTIGYAVGVWLVFMGVSSAFEQAGLNGNLPPKLAVWTPLFLFSMIGLYLLSKVKT